MSLSAKVKTREELYNLIQADRRLGIPEELHGLLFLSSSFRFYRNVPKVFDASRMFVQYDPATGKEPAVRFYDIGFMFRSHYLGGEDNPGVMEELVDPIMLVFMHQLQRRASERQIFEYLQLRNRPTGMSLATTYAMLEKQPTGEVGFLLSDPETTNLCFPKDFNGTPQLGVFECSRENGWRLRSRFPFLKEDNSRRDWFPGTLIFTEVPLCVSACRMSRAKLKRGRRHLRGKG